MGMDHEIDELAGMRFAAKLRHQFEELARDAARTRGSFFARVASAAMKRKWLVAAAVVAAAVIAVLLVGLPGLHDTGPTPATAYEKTRAALIRVRGVHGLVMTSRAVVEYGKIGVRTKWVLSARGDWSYESRYYTAAGNLREAPHFKTYEASTNTERFWSWGTSAAGLLSWRRGGPPCDLQAQPGQDAVTAVPLFAGDFRAYAISALESSHAKPRDVAMLGRSAWQVTVSGASLEPTFASMDLVIDKRTGIILQRTLYGTNGRVFSRETVTRLEVNPQLPKGEPRTSFPVAAHFRALPSMTHFNWEATPSRPLMTIADHGAVRLPLALLAHRGGGGKVLLAGWLPAGFKLRLSTYGDGIQLLYRAGLDFLLTQTYRGTDVPLPPPQAGSAQIRLTGGFLAGSTAYFDSETSAQVRGQGITVYATGTVSHDELVLVLNSLAPYKD